MANPAKEARDKAQAKWAGATIEAPPGFSARQRRSIIHKHPTDPDRYMLDTHTGPIHIEGTETEIDSAWVPGDSGPYRLKMELADYNAYAGLDDPINFDAGQIVKYIHPSSGEDVAFQPQSIRHIAIIEASGDEAYSDISLPQEIAGIVDDDVIRWTDGYGAGVDFEWETQTIRLAKKLIIQNNTALPTPPAWMNQPPYNGNIYFGLQFIFEKSSGMEIWVDGTEWDENPNNPIETESIVEFRLSSTGEPLWWFGRVWSESFGRDDEDVTPMQRFRKTGPNLFVEVRIPWAWLETVEYPVIIDPSVTPLVGAGADDASESGDNILNITVANMEVRSSATSSTEKSIGARFDVTGISQGDTINSGTYAELYNNHNSRDDIDGNFYAHDYDASLSFSAAAEREVYNRTQTSASVAFADDNWVNNTWWGSSYELQTVIAEVVARGSWDENYITILYMALTSLESRFQGYAYEGSTTLCPRLHVEYTAAGAAGQPTPIRTQGVPTGSGSRDRPSGWN